MSMAGKMSTSMRVSDRPPIRSMSSDMTATV